MLVFTILALCLLGWLLGSLINYISDVLPATRRLGRAECSACSEQRTLLDYLLVRACTKCGQQRSARSWVVQFAAVAIILGQWFYPYSRTGFWVGTVLLTYFAVVAVIDIEHRLILYVESAFGAVLGLAVGVWLHGWVATLLGGLAGLGMMAAMYLLGFALAKLFGKMRGEPIEEDAMGFSDILLCAVLGLILGWPGIAAGVVFTILIAGAGSIVILVSQFLRKTYQPFAAVAYGPYMLLAAILLLYWPK
jgi:prepilin signal peptidase PulO-like enzyme (type II secretory pathway)